METMLTRLRKVFLDSGESQTAIAKKTNVTSAYIWKILNNDSVRPRDLFIDSVCREYNINEKWLRTGEGEMQATISQDERFAINVGKLQRTDDETIIRWVNMIAETNPEVLKDIESFMKKLLNIED